LFSCPTLPKMHTNHTSDRLCVADFICGMKQLCVLSLSLSQSRSGDGSPPWSSPGSSISVSGRFDSGDLAMIPAAPGHVLGSVTPDVLPSRQHHCNVDKWRSLDVRCGADRLPTMENGPCGAVPPWRTDLWSSHAASNGEDAPCWCMLGVFLRVLEIVYLLLSQCDDVTAGSQTSAEKNRVCSNYARSQLYVVTQNATATQQLDLALAKGCVVAVIKESDPMGNRDRWFIDNGGLFCFAVNKNWHAVTSLWNLL